MGRKLTYNMGMAMRFEIRCESDAMHHVSDAMRYSFGYICAMADAMRNPMCTIARRYTDGDSISYFD